jgi:hypothetical protein
MNKIMKKGIILGTLGVAIVGLVGCFVKTLMTCSIEHDYEGNYENCDFTNNDEELS